MAIPSFFVTTIEPLPIIYRGHAHTRPLGIPTVADRIAQMVVKRCLEPNLDRLFHPDSYGYRPGKSAIEAVGQARQRCWDYDWVLDLDIRGFFDNIDHALLMRAVRKHADEKWVVLYIERWLTAPVQMPDGKLVPREKGTPQGGVISPLLANLFLHYAFDCWMARYCPTIPFERYADDAVCHCKSEAQALWLRRKLDERLSDCGLELHPEKTHVVFCKDDNRRGDYPSTKFDFLGYTFRTREAKNRWGAFFVTFSPAVSAKASQRIRHTIRSWRLHRRTGTSLDELSLHVQSRSAGLDQLLQPLLSLGSDPDVSVSQSPFGPLGLSEVQTAARAPQASTTVAARYYPAAA